MNMLVHAPHAHAPTSVPRLMALVMGVGIQLTTGVIVGTADGVAKAVGTAVPGVLLILIGCFTPLALFRMLAFARSRIVGWLR